MPFSLYLMCIVRHEAFVSRQPQTKANPNASCPHPPLLSSTQGVAMAQYFDFPVKIPASDDAITDVIRAAWSDQDPIVAVATRNKKLWVAQEEVGGWPLTVVVRFVFVFWWERNSAHLISHSPSWQPPWMSQSLVVRVYFVCLFTGGGGLTGPASGSMLCHVGALCVGR